MNDQRCSAKISGRGARHAATAARARRGTARWPERTRRGGDTNAAERTQAAAASRFREPEGSVRGERANFTRLALGWLAGSAVSKPNVVSEVCK